MSGEVESIPSVDVPPVKLEGGVAEGGGGVKEEPRPDSPDSMCAICLERLNNKAFTDRCLHTFCFACLLEWSKIKQECPLCKKKFVTIIHNVRSEEDYDEFPVHNLNPVEPTVLINLALRPPFRYRTTMAGRALVYIDHLRWGGSGGAGSSREVAGAPDVNSSRSITHDWRRRRQLGTSEFRRNIYRQGLWVRRSSDPRVRHSSPEFYRLNPAQTHRLVPWLNRELNVLLDLSLDSHAVCQEILNLITVYPITSSHFHRAMEQYLGVRTAHFMHEFYNFATSPYDMLAYDLHAQYSTNVEIPSDELLTGSGEERSGGSGRETTTSSSTTPPLPPRPPLCSLSSASSDSDSDVEVIGWRPQPLFSLDMGLPGTSSGGPNSDGNSARLLIEISDDDDENDDGDSVEFVEEFRRTPTTPEIITIDSDEENPVPINEDLISLVEEVVDGTSGGVTREDDERRASEAAVPGAEVEGTSGRKRRRAAVNALVKYEFTSTEDSESDNEMRRKGRRRKQSHNKKKRRRRRSSSNTRSSGSSRRNCHRIKSEPVSSSPESDGGSVWSSEGGGRRSPEPKSQRRLRSVVTVVRPQPKRPTYPYYREQFSSPELSSDLYD